MKDRVEGKKKRVVGEVIFGGIGRNNRNIKGDVR